MKNHAISDDEKSLRDFFASWQKAAAAGDLAGLLELLADDVVFLMLGRAPICGKASFAALSQRQGKPNCLEMTWDFGDAVFLGDWAHCWTRLSVKAISVEGATPVCKSGNTLSIFRKKTDGSWLLVRDANMLTNDLPEPRR